ncbi:hypothetical protein DKX38_010497 [Salix brachista]|uniref:DUF2921 domain-containing protein n=1 Tax=Salix brachista TaxID=2182728 RepID=A0A5N5MGD5_9ROSI|nr:hypothetical protein DKX38_010497 [Salix brachista]
MGMAKAGSNYNQPSLLQDDRILLLLRGAEFCEILGMITGAGAGSFVIVPNWRCNGTDDFCRKLSPFVSDENTKAIDESFKGVKLFSNMAVVADGIRKSSTGQLYMVDCLGIVDSEGNTCNSRISFRLVNFPGPLPRSPPRTAADFHIHMRKLFNPDEAQYTEKQLLINVPVQITLDGEAYSNFTELFLEALYDPRAGKMYIVGCRDVRASWNILFESMDLEAGLDCLTGAIVSYPPITALWLANPAARISISSHRNEDDPLYFSTVKLRTLPIYVSKTFYLAVGSRGPPLITGAEALLQRKPSESYESSSYYLEKNQWLNVIDYVVKILVMALSEGVEISYQITYKKPL